MKRIGIVFLGLICLALFGVGFNVNAEEVTAPIVSVDLDDDGSGAPVLNWKIEFGNGSFPDTPTVSGSSSATSTYVYELTDPDGDVASTYSVTLSTGADGSHSVTAEGYDAPEDKVDRYEGFMCESMNAATIKGKLALSQDENTKTGTFKIIQTSPVEKDENSETVTAYKVDLASAGGPDDVGFSVDDPQYLLPGESVKVQATSETIDKHPAKADGTEKVYTYHNWSAAGGVTVTAGVRSDSEITITKTATDETGTVTANYGNVRMKISGLTPNTEYYVYVRTYCSESEQSDWAWGGYFTTYPTCHPV
ncbi:MAG: hypothetical protein IKQ40_01280, partial [Lachnospiraceae bacterium]|nr:hypothetical protein [Lachnospiraceae bacterium]